MRKLKPRKSKASQRARFIKAAREAGASEDEREFDANLKRITEPKPRPQQRSPRPGD
jgi:hypothetical protein